MDRHGKTRCPSSVLDGDNRTVVAKDPLGDTSKPSYLCPCQLAGGDFSRLCERSSQGTGWCSLSQRSMAASQIGWRVAAAHRSSWFPADPQWKEMGELRRHVRTGRPLGDETFVGRLEEMLGRALKARKPGPKPKHRAN